MHSKLDICNRALRMIGENRITSLEENNRIADECKFLYPIIKREVIEKYPWKCAQKAIILRNLYINDSEELNEYGNKFLLPFDCIRVLAVDGDNFFHRDGLYLYAPSNSIKIIYSTDIEEKYMTVRLVKYYLYS